MKFKVLSFVIQIFYFNFKKKKKKVLLSVTVQLYFPGFWTAFGKPILIFFFIMLIFLFKKKKEILVLSACGVNVWSNPYSTNNLDPLIILLIISL